MTRIDLHSHSTRSDGLETPTEVFEHAHTAGVNILAMTDHDTTSGWAEAAEAAARLGMGFVPGAEVSSRAIVSIGDRERHISVHMLAYLIDPNHEPLKSVMHTTTNFRESRAQRMVDRLSEDFEITWDLVLESIEEGATIGRPALADALVKLGVVSDRTEAFAGPLHKNSKYYIATETVDTVDIIKLIRDAGGVPIIAHPLTDISKSASRSDLPQEHFEKLIDAGLAGFEVYHREVPENARDWLLMLARKYDLIVTGSSDYHGINGKPNRLGENTTSSENLDRILQTATGCAALL